MLFFGFPHVKRVVAKLRERIRSTKTVNEQYTDQLNILMRSYKEVPLWWYITLFLITFVIMVTILATGNLFVPVWIYFIAIGTGALIVVVRSC